LSFVLTEFEKPLGLVENAKTQAIDALQGYEKSTPYTLLKTRLKRVWE